MDMSVFIWILAIIGGLFLFDIPQTIYYSFRKKNEKQIENKSSDSLEVGESE